MSNNNLTYRARIANNLINGIKTPTYEKIIKELLSCGDVFKKEEIDNYVSLKTGLKLDDSLSAAISNALAKLKKDNIIVNISHGLWKIC